MRAVPLAVLALALLGCRPTDAGVPIAENVSGSDAVQNRGGYRVGPLRVIDGDTFVSEGETIRIANIDAPKLSPGSECLAEANLAAVAKRELDQILGASWAGTGSAIIPRIERSGRDQYGRTLARVGSVDGKDVGEALVAKGVAVRWTGKRADWCRA
jgi:endonuclease YncB( thermonuclease family)